MRDPGNEVGLHVATGNQALGVNVLRPFLREVPIILNSEDRFFFLLHQTNLNPLQYFCAYNSWIKFYLKMALLLGNAQMDEEFRYTSQVSLQALLQWQPLCLIFKFLAGNLTLAIPKRQTAQRNERTKPEILSESDSIAVGKG